MLADYKILNAEEYGVLQRRRRVIIIGRKGKAKLEFPKLTTLKNSWQIKRDLFADLPHLIPGQEMNIARYTKKINEYRQTTVSRNEIDFTTQHITRNHNERFRNLFNCH